ncbi:MAG: HAD family hydrolase [Acidobacteriota bacterium]
MTTPAALLFDFGGTLDADGVAWKDRFFALVSEAGVAVEREVFDRAFYRADDALVGHLPKELSLQETVERLAGDLSKALGQGPELARTVAAKFVADALTKLDENARLLAGLSSRYRIGVVSNFYGNLQAICSGTSIGRYVDVAVDSEAVGAEKPDPRIFQAALSALDTDAGRAVFVGDSLPRDMAGARGLGMPHVWLQPGATHGCCPGDAVIASLAELTRVIP